MKRTGLTIAAATVALMVGCASRSAGNAVSSAAPLPPPLEIETQDSIAQQMYESGRYGELVSRVSETPADALDAKDLWLAAHANLRLGQNEEAARLFKQLGSSGDPGWQMASQLALAAIEHDAAAEDQARSAAAGFPANPYVQHELGLAHWRREEFASAAQAFERAIVADPHFAYAHYYAGLAYDRLQRADLMATKLEMFLRLAPEAPERPGVESILRTVRRRRD